MACDGSGRIFVAGEISCIYRNGWICEPSLLRPSALQPLFEGTATSFFARLSFQEPVVPKLKIAGAVTNLPISWPVEATNYFLEAITSLQALSWTTVTNTPTVTVTNRTVELPLTGNAGFFRFRKP